MTIDVSLLPYSTVLEKLVALSTNYEYFSIHCSNQHPSKYAIIAGFGAKQIFNSLPKTQLNDKQWKFGLVSYDTKNTFEELNSQHENLHELNDVSFFIPEIVINYQGNKLTVFSQNNQQEKEIAEEITRINYKKEKREAIILQAKTSKEQYIQRVQEIKNRIQLGDIYELNYCINYYNNNTTANCNELFLELNKISETPFACYTKHKNNYIISSSPERFIKKQENTLTTEPIKGTAARGKNENEEKKIKQELFNNPKERNENVMIVDVSRNDLSRIATKGSVKVNELFKVKTYKQVHQLVSTISCELKPNTSLQEIFKASFPPASMTGAPKIRAMQLIDEYENFRRGAYSGTVGFIEPTGDFDFNVIIRSVIYNSKSNYISYSVGSAITAKCDAEKEYEECMLKAKAMKEILERE